MTVSVTLTSPPDDELVSKWPEYIRRVASLLDDIYTTISGLAITDVALVDGQNILEVGNHLADVAVEIVFLSCESGSADIEYISEGSNGQLKFFIINTTNIKLSNDSNISLNQTYSNEFESAIHDMIAFVNLDGNPDLGVDGTWREILRNLAV